MLRKVSFSAVAAFVVLGALVLPASSANAVTVSHAELKDGLLHLDGMAAAPGIFVTVRSSTSFAGARSEYALSGAYHVQAANFRADDCQVVVSDRHSPDATVTLPSGFAAPPGRQSIFIIGVTARHFSPRPDTPLS